VENVYFFIEFFPLVFIIFLKFLNFESKFIEISIDYQYRYVSVTVKFTYNRDYRSIFQSLLRSHPQPPSSSLHICLDLVPPRPHAALPAPPCGRDPGAQQAVMEEEGGGDGYLARETGWGIRRMGRVGEEMRQVVQVQADAFQVPVALFDDFFDFLSAPTGIDGTGRVVKGKAKAVAI
jgi:hypothetical protein